MFLLEQVCVELCCPDDKERVDDQHDEPADEGDHAEKADDAEDDRK